MITDKFGLTGDLLVQIKNKEGVVTFEQEIKNLIVTAGKALVASRLKDNTNNSITHMAIGTDATAANTGQTALVAELARQAMTSTTVVSNVITYVATYAPGVGTGTIVEAGLFNDPTVGTMLSRTASLSAIKGASDSLTITWTITVN